MEIKLNAGDKITIPTGCKATIEDNLIVIEEKKEEKQEEFKDGDILHSNITDTIVIFKNYANSDNLTFNSYYNNENTADHSWGTHCFYLATEEEKQAFFDELNARGLRWNAETKTMERIRRRAKEGETFLFINNYGEVCETTEAGVLTDDEYYNLGNYYLPEERDQAKEDAKAVKAIYEKRLKV